MTLAVIKDLARQAGQAILAIYDQFEPGQEVSKADQSPLTAADLAANAIIVAGLRATFPSFAILSEEEKDNLDRLTNDWCFIVDPLDGTKEFIKKNGEFTVNIALAHQGQPVLGVIYAPVLDELYYAEQGKGAFLEKDGQPPIRLQVSHRTSKLRAVASRSHLAPELEDLLNRHGVTDFVAMGSSLKGCLVAKGEADIYFRHNPTMEWDTAAMQCIVEEAGGIFRQMDDSPMTYNRKDSLNAKGFYAINKQENRLN